MAGNDAEQEVGTESKQREEETQEPGEGACGHFTGEAEEPEAAHVRVCALDVCVGRRGEAVVSGWQLCADEAHRLRSWVDNRHSIEMMARQSGHNPEEHADMK